eukprot:gene6331-7873_t
MTDSDRPSDWRQDFECDNFQTQTECVDCHSSCLNNNFQKKKWKKLEVRSTDGKGFGLFAKEPIPSGSFVIEFLGEIINHEEYVSRLQDVSGQRMYVLALKSKTYIDCRKKGSIARFINHSCEPNCRLEVWNVNNHLKIGAFCLKDIAMDEELSFDYQWDPSDFPPTRCLCGTLRCRGFLEIFRSEAERRARVGRGAWVHRAELSEDTQ